LQKFWDKKKLILLAILLVSLCIRLFYVLHLPQIEVESDPKGYDEIALSLVERGEFSEWRLNQRIARPPGYPLLLAGIYSLFGHSYLAVRVWHSLFGTLTVLFVYLICVRFLKLERIAFLAAALVGLHPALIGYTGILYTETVFAFFLVICIYFLQRTISEEKLSHFLFSGSFLGLAALTSSRIIYFPFLFLIISLLFLETKKRVILKRWLIMVFFMLLTIAPWTIRNYLVTGKFILLENYHKAALWFATNPYDVHEWGDERINQLIEGRTPVEYERIMYEEGKRYLREHPFIYLKNSCRRFFRLWVSGHSNLFSGFEKSFVYAWKNSNFKLFAIKFLFLAFNLFVLSFGFLGIFLTSKYQFKDYIVVLSPIIYLTLLHSLTVAAPRLSVPIIPFILIFSALGIEKCMEKVKRITL